MAEQWRENLADNFLMECWADDPASKDCDQETGSSRWSAAEVGEIVNLYHQEQFGLAI